MSIRKPPRLPDPTFAWFDPSTGIPTKAVYEYFRDLDFAMRALLAERDPVTVANLPAAATAGDLAYASNGRKNGETLGNGTGVLVFRDGTAWRAVDTGATVAA